MLGKCKWRPGPVDRSVLTAVTEKATEVVLSKGHFQVDHRRLQAGKDGVELLGGQPGLKFRELALIGHHDDHRRRLTIVWQLHGYVSWACTMAIDWDVMHHGCRDPAAIQPRECTAGGRLALEPLRPRSLGWMSSEVAQSRCDTVEVQKANRGDGGVAQGRHTYTACMRKCGLKRMVRTTLAGIFAERDIAKPV